MNFARLFTATATVALALTGASTAAAQDFPTRAVTIVVPYSVGGTTDIVARLVGKVASETLGQSVVVENKVGASGAIGWGDVARAKPDGYTLLTTEMSFTIAPSLLSNLPFDSKKDFTQVITAASAPHVLVVPASLPVKTVQDFIKLAKSKPGELNYGSGGTGTNTHLGAELFKKAAGVNLMHIPYKGSGQALTDLMAGQVQALVTSLPTALPHIKSGALRALVVTSNERSPSLPDVPSAKEVNLPSFVMDFWVGFSVPAGTPPNIVNTLNHAIAKALKTPEGKKLLAQQGLDPVANTPEQATALVSSEMERWADIVKSAGIKVE